MTDLQYLYPQLGRSAGRELESIAELAKAAQVVGETFEQIETDLVNALTGKS
jgi:hypothetical protein